MGKSLFIAEKPSVAREFANALKINMVSKDGYMESEETIITWCVGHLVTMSYPEVYDEKYKRWSFDTIPFLPEEFKYEVIESAKKQYRIVSSLLNRADVSTIYVCTDSGREGEYIYRLVEQMSGVKGKARKRVWIDSQTEEEIMRGIREAKDLSEYDNLSNAAYLRAKEDYLMGINFSRVLTLKYGRSVKDYLKRDRAVISVGRVMTCVLGIVVNREREIRSFVKTPFYRVLGNFKLQGKAFSGEWKAVEGSPYYMSPKLYKENGFKERETAETLIVHLQEEPVGDIVVESIERKKENKNPPLLYNLAELQNDCSKLFKISPDETLRIVQECLEEVSKSGTAAPFFSDTTHLRVAAKTGTAQVTSGAKGRYLGSMVAYFPAEQPRYTVLTTICTHQQPGKAYYGASLAGPVVKRVVDYIYASEQTWSEPLAAEPVQQPSNRLAGGSVEALEEVTTTLPDVCGLGLRDALFQLERGGLQVKIVGSGVVVRQMPQAGAPLRPGTEVTIWLK